MIPLRDDIPGRGRPRAVRLLLVANLVGGAAQVLLAPWFTERFAMRPALVVGAWRSEPVTLIREAITAGGQRVQVLQELFPGLEAFATLITSQFLHGDILHLASNLLFLWIFADNVEGEIGSGRFLLFYLACGVLAGLCHVLSDPSSTVPTIGASGAIAGVLGAYFIRFPHARVLTIVPIFIIPFIVEIPAVVFLGLWFVLQVIYGLTGTAGHLAVWAHAGGFVAGLLLVGLFPRVRARRRSVRRQHLPFERAR